VENQLINIANNNGVLTVGSVEVARHFEKQHKHILQTIHDLTAENSTAKNMFIESTYENRGKQYPQYLITRDGFSLLVMSFTGKKALEWKLKYIEAFNKMETALKQAIPTLDVAKAKELKIKEDRATAMLLNAQNRMIKTLLSNTKDKNLSQIAIDVMGIKAVEQITGKNMNQYLPECEKLYSATEVGGMFGVSAMKIGKTANASGLKNDTYGKMVMSKSKHSSKEVQQFLYNEKGVQALGKILGKTVKTA
jgi:Rha family phage regulatory protein